MGARTTQDSLTPREEEVARLAAGGMSTTEIADVLHIAPGTVASHLRAVYAKLGVHRRAALHTHLSS
jgi:DNA-binding CsgD family transcriptional regulator